VGGSGKMQKVGSDSEPSIREVLFQPARGVASRERAVMQRVATEHSEKMTCSAPREQRGGGGRKGSLLLERGRGRSEGRGGGRT